MRLSIEKKDLIQNIQHLATMVPSKNTSPILTNYLIDVNADSNLVQVTASDLEITVVVQFPANVTESGTIAVSARHFNEIINSMPDQMINLTKQDELLKIQCNKIDFSLMCADHTLFPVIPPRQLENAITIPAELFSRMVSKTSFAVSTDINRAVLTGVCWSIKQDHHLMVATDGRKVAEIRINDTTLKPAESISSEDNIFNVTKIENIERIIPVKSLNFLQKIFDSEEKDLNVLIDSNRIMFAYGKYTVFTHIIEHKYPDYQKAFIGDLPNTLVIEKDLLRTAIRRIALIAPDENLRIRFEVSMDQFEISTVNRDTGEAKQMMENYSYQGTATSVSFNFKFMLSILDTIDTERVKIMMGSSKDPLMIYNETTPEKQEVTFLLMPLRS